jgi:hypothetical protein
MLLFRSEEHVNTWCQSWNRPLGGLLTIEQTWRLAQAWYSPDRRKLSWRRRSLEEVEALFAELGLVGPFWSLRPD